MLNLFDNNLENNSFEDNELQYDHLLTQPLEWDDNIFGLSTQDCEDPFDHIPESVWDSCESLQMADKEMCPTEYSTDHTSEETNKSEAVSHGKKLEAKRLLKKCPSAYNLFIKDKVRFF